MQIAGEILRQVKGKWDYILYMYITLPDWWEMRTQIDLTNPEVDLLILVLATDLHL